MTATMSPRRRKAHGTGKPPVPGKPPTRDSAWDASRLRAVWSRVDPDPTATGFAVGVTTETLRRWRLGMYVPDAIELRRLARLLGVTTDELLPPE